MSNDSDIACLPVVNLSVAKQYGKLASCKAEKETGPCLITFVARNTAFGQAKERAGVDGAGHNSGKDSQRSHVCNP